MERIVQYLDDLEDLIYAFALKWERIRSGIRFAAFMASSLGLQLLCVALALANPALAAGVAMLLTTGLLLETLVGKSRPRFSRS